MKMDDDAVLVLQGRYASPSDDCSASAYRRICSGEIRHIFQIVDVTNAVDFGNIGHVQAIYRKGIGFAVEFKGSAASTEPYAGCGASSGKGCGCVGSIFRNSPSGRGKNSGSREKCQECTFHVDPPYSIKRELIHAGVQLVLDAAQKAVHLRLIWNGREFFAGKMIDDGWRLQFNFRCASIEVRID
jgi:hypothetical protein